MKRNNNLQALLAGLNDVEHALQGINYPANEKDAIQSMIGSIRNLAIDTEILPAEAPKPLPDLADEVLDTEPLETGVKPSEKK